MSLFSPLRIYAAYVKPDAADGQQRPELIKEGFNIFAFLLGFFWAVYHRLWLPVLYIIIFNVIVIAIGKMQLLTEPSLGVIQMGFQFYVGFQASDWRQKKLRSKGYTLLDVVAAENQTRAEQRYFERALATA